MRLRVNQFAHGAGLIGPVRLLSFFPFFFLGTFFFLPFACTTNWISKVWVLQSDDAHHSNTLVNHTLFYPELAPAHTGTHTHRQEQRL